MLGGTATGDVRASIGADGARTVPARENGGNHDIKNFSRGSRVFCPVHVPGALPYGVSTNPIFMPGNVEPRYSEFISFIGISVDHDTDTNRYLDATLADQNA